MIVPIPFAEWTPDLVAAVAGLLAKGPANLLKRVNIDRDGTDQIGVDDLQALVAAHTQHDNAGVRQLALALAEWDFAKDAAWDAGTAPRTAERRARVYALLDLPAQVTTRLDVIAPVATMRPIVISTKWTPWYTEDRRNQSAFYWPHYQRYLLEHSNWPAESVAALDQATTEVVRRLSDPTADTLYQTKGLVVGYVQSGKTANFTGVIAKAIDAGYRLVIVMTGTIELLRSQTQRRLDRELVGRENLTRGLDDGDAADEFDYADDPDWLAGRFISHGDDFTARGIPGIERMTLLHDDYKRLKHGLSRMQFHLRDRSKRFYEPDNLMPADARLVVVKKNASVLRKLAQDLKPLKDKLAEIPALIIDDESDLASINTRDPRKTKERTAINEAITDLLGRLPRGQLVMYTATPFANFFVDPDDPGNIFPKNFILTLDRPPHYMGVKDFHDVDWNTEDDKNDPRQSNECAYVRPVGPPPDEDDAAGHTKRQKEMGTALDSFMLAGAIKVFREGAGAAPYRHHTMLVHESTDTKVHAEQAELVRDAWKNARYGTPQALTRLAKLWESDFRPVCLARADGFAVPQRFEELIDAVGEAHRRITEVGDPVLIVNSDDDVQRNQQALDFDRNDVWRILVGGAKLSRGFTLEGLTTSFYTRRALQGDTLMQAGRWFGFRHGYRDLVRLFIRRDPVDQIGRVDLYEAFEGLMRDELALREQLGEYEGFNADGTPILEPWQVPPIVSQHLPYLKPTSRTKMFNAHIDSQGRAGKLQDFYGLTAPDQPDLKHDNYLTTLPLLRAADATPEQEREFISAKRRPEDAAGTFKALTGHVPADQVLHIIDQIIWDPAYRKKNIDPMLRFLRELAQGGQLDDFLIVWPRLKGVADYELPDLGIRQVVERRRRDLPRVGFVGSDSKHRDAIERIAGRSDSHKDPAAHDLRDQNGRRAAMLVYVAHDPTLDNDGRPHPRVQPGQCPRPQDLAVLMSIAAPASATPHGGAVIRWTVSRKSDWGLAVVPVAGTSA